MGFVAFVHIRHKTPYKAAVTATARHGYFSGKSVWEVKGELERKSELYVVMKAKDLSKYILTVTAKSPKQFRFTFTIRMQNLSLEIIEKIYLANETFVSGPEAKERYRQRLNYQHEALTKIKLLAYFAQVALEQKAILPKHYEQIAKQSTECQYLLGGWIKNDRSRFSG
jgi:hypothetical protein